MKAAEWVRLTVHRLMNFERFEASSTVCGDDPDVDPVDRDLTEDEWADKYGLFLQYMAEPPVIGDPEEPEEDPIVGDLEPEEPGTTESSG